MSQSIAPQIRDKSEKYDIVVIGAGPVGLVLSTCLARWGYKIKHIDNRAEPTPSGRADGIQPRSLDFLKNLGLKHALMRHNPAKVYEVAFWDPSSKGIARTGTWASCPSFIDARYPFTTLLHQGFIERTFIQDLAENGVTVERPWTILDFENDGQDPQYPVRAKLARADAEGDEQVVRAKYLFSGEGARSFVRDKLGIQVRHKDPIAHVWGVMDGVVRTNFPDIKMKCTIHSDAGSIMVIPRENNMVRLYIQIASSTDSDWNPRKTATAEEVQARAKKIFSPYHIAWDTVDWYSVYPIGQGISDRYTLDERVFLGGDACHTHSPKAGQGMNTAFLDAQNLAWKLHLVEAGFASRSILKTYESERRYIAEELLAFDARYAKLFSSRVPNNDEVGQANSGHASEDNDFVKTFKENCEFTSGYGVTYQANIFNWRPDAHPARHNLFLSFDQGTKLQTGRLIPPCTVTRVEDANTVHLEHQIPVNGAFRVYVFAGNLLTSNSKQSPPQALTDFANASIRPRSFLGAHLRRDIAQVSFHERHAPHSHFFTLATIIAGRRSDIAIDTMLPPLLGRYRQHIYADDVPDLRVLSAKAAAHAKLGFEANGQISPAVVVVRPDAYVGCVVKLVEGTGTVDAVDAYFSSFVEAFGRGQEKLLQAQL